nr:DNAj subfamily C member [Hymenolepis microstoma]
MFFCQSDFASVLLSDPLLIASKVRDQDELRLAEADSQIALWKLNKTLPLNINTMLDYNGNHNLLIIIITSNRGHRRVDSFEPYYLTQTSIALFKSLLSKRGRDFKNVGKIKVLVCTISHINDSSHDVYGGELIRLRRTFGPNIFISPPRHPDNSCKHTRDMSSCISLGIKKFPESDAVVVLEDDFLVTKHFHSVLDLYAKQLGKSVLSLYPPSHDGHLKIYFYIILSIFCLLTLAVSLHVFRKKWIGYMPAFAALISIILLLDEYNKAEIPTIFPAQDPNSRGLGAAVILPKEIAAKVSEVDYKMTCHSGKGKRIARIASELGYSILNVRPSAVVHIGMYSQTRDKIYDPNLFPH